MRSNCVLLASLSSRIYTTLFLVHYPYNLLDSLHNMQLHPIIAPIRLCSHGSDLQPWQNCIYMYHDIGLHLRNIVRPIAVVPLYATTQRVFLCETAVSRQTSGEKLTQSSTYY